MTQAKSEAYIYLSLLHFSQEHEDAVSFANRVKSEIASRGGLVELDW